MSDLPNIILLSVDALRADHLSGQGYHRETTPFLDSLSDRAVGFDTCISASSHTREAVPALLSGEYPDVFAAAGFRHATDTVADRLSVAGYATAGFHSNPYVSRAYGFDSGFDTFDDDLVLGRNRFVALAQRALNKFLLKKGNYHARADEINQKSLSWLDSLNTDRPIFLWNHYMDPHGPYNPPHGNSYAETELSDHDAQALYQKAINRPDEISEDERQLLIDTYDGEIQYLDDQLREFFNELADRELLKESLVVVTADHGDAFGEHGYYTHPRHLHESLLHVPLIVSVPGGDSEATVTQPVSTLDIVPTILEYANISRGGLPGTPLVNETGVVERKESSVVFGIATGEDEDEGIRQFAGRTETKKVIIEREIEDGSICNQEGFDLGLDPGEQKPVRDLDQELPELRQRVLSFSTDRLGSVNGDVERSTDDPEVEDRLKALGYK